MKSIHSRDLEGQYSTNFPSLQTLLEESRNDDVVQGREVRIPRSELCSPFCTTLLDAVHHKLQNRNWIDSTLDVQSDRLLFLSTKRYHSLHTLGGYEVTNIGSFLTLAISSCQAHVSHINLILVEPSSGKTALRQAKPHDLRSTSGLTSSIPLTSKHISDSLLLFVYLDSANVLHFA